MNYKLSMIKRIIPWFVLLLYLNTACLNSNKDYKIYCIEFTTTNNELLSLVEKVNNKTKDNFPCDSWSQSSLDIGSDDIPDASSIWGFYSKAKNFKLFDYSLITFMDKFYRSKIGSEKCAIVIKEIESWRDNPQMDSNTLERINNALEE